MEKKSNKLFGFLVILSIALLSAVMVVIQPVISQGQGNELNVSSLDTNEYFLDDLFLYNMVQYQYLKSLEADEVLSVGDVYLNKEDRTGMNEELLEDFFDVYGPYYGSITDLYENFYVRLQDDGHGLLDFYAESGEVRSYTKDLSDLKKENSSAEGEFKWYLIMSYDAQGKLSVSHASDALKETIGSKFFSGSLMESSTFDFSSIVQNGVSSASDRIDIQPIINATFIYAISNEHFQNIADGYYYSPYFPTYFDNTSGPVVLAVLMAGGLAVVAALFIATRHVRELAVYDLALKCPFEIALGIYTTLVMLLWSICCLTYFGTANNQNFINDLLNLVPINQVGIWKNVILYILMFVYLFMVTVCVYFVKAIFIEGIGSYLMNHSICGYLFRKIKEFLDIFRDLNFADNSMRKVIIALLINLLVGSISCMFFAGGIIFLIIYTLLAMLYIQKVLRQVTGQFKELSRVTDELANGNLDVEVQDDLVLFGDVKEHLLGIKDGFKRAVEEEVRSTKMKTELISNVSHDLKTPLTTLISYIDLLQNKDLPESEKERYIQILANNSQRLKRCIEDLFEISKVESGNVQCNLMEVNIIDLLRQMQFELSDKIEASSLIFKTQYPEKKIMCLLDSSKTYRIFENLYINILKYAMPNTRVYVDAKEDDGWITVMMKNISATEIIYEGDELTERFVRNDASRNSEGSGLGLAIAKSFTELQGGIFKIDVDGDLFKVMIRFKTMKQEVTTENEE